MNDILAKLAAPFDPAKISWRVGPVDNKENPTKGIALAYIDARDVQDRFDAVMGADWQNDFPHAGTKTVCRIGLKVNNEWVWRSDGAGDTDMEAEKGGLSDAFKRAAVKWGVGRYLYDVDSPWVEVEKKGRSVVIKKSELARLQKLLGPMTATERHLETVAQKQDGTPAAKPVWNGPLKITELKQKLSALRHDIEGMTDSDEFVGTVGDNYPLLRQCYLDLKGWWVNPEGGGARATLLKKGAELKVEMGAWIISIEQGPKQQEAAE